MSASRSRADIIQEQKEQIQSLFSRHPLVAGLISEFIDVMSYDEEHLVITTITPQEQFERLLDNISIDSEPAGSKLAIESFIKQLLKNRNAANEETDVENSARLAGKIFETLIVSKMFAEIKADLVDEDHKVLRRILLGNDDTSVCRLGSKLAEIIVELNLEPAYAREKFTLLFGSLRDPGIDIPTLKICSLEYFNETESTALFLENNKRHLKSIIRAQIQNAEAARLICNFIDTIESDDLLPDLTNNNLFERMNRGLAQTTLGQFSYNDHKVSFGRRLGEIFKASDYRVIETLSDTIFKTVIVDQTYASLTAPNGFLGGDDKVELRKILSKNFLKEKIIELADRARDPETMGVLVDPFLPLQGSSAELSPKPPKYKGDKTSLKNALATIGIDDPTNEVVNTLFAENQMRRLFRKIDRDWPLTATEKNKIYRENFSKFKNAKDIADANKLIKTFFVAEEKKYKDLWDSIQRYSTGWQRSEDKNEFMSDNPAFARNMTEFFEKLNRFPADQPLPQELSEMMTQAGLTNLLYVQLFLLQFKTIPAGHPVMKLLQNSDYFDRLILGKTGEEDKIEPERVQLGSKFLRAIFCTTPEPLLRDGESRGDYFSRNFDDIFDEFKEDPKGNVNYQQLAELQVDLSALKKELYSHIYYKCVSEPATPEQKREKDVFVNVSHELFVVLGKKWTEIESLLNLPASERGRVGVKAFTDLLKQVGFMFTKPLPAIPGKQLIFKMIDYYPLETIAYLTPDTMKSLFSTREGLDFAIKKLKEPAAPEKLKKELIRSLAEHQLAQMSPAEKDVLSKTLLLFTMQKYVEPARSPSVVKEDNTYLQVAAHDGLRRDYFARLTPYVHALADENAELKRLWDDLVYIGKNNSGIAPSAENLRDLSQIIVDATELEYLDHLNKNNKVALLAEINRLWESKTVARDERSLLDLSESGLRSYQLQFKLLKKILDDSPSESDMDVVTKSLFLASLNHARHRLRFNAEQQALLSTHQARIDNYTTKLHPFIDEELKREIVAWQDEVKSATQGAAEKLQQAKTVLQLWSHIHDPAHNPMPAFATPAVEEAVFSNLANALTHGGIEVQTKVDRERTAARAEQQRQAEEKARERAHRVEEERDLLAEEKAREHDRRDAEEKRQLAQQQEEKRIELKIQELDALGQKQVGSINAIRKQRERTEQYLVSIKALNVLLLAAQQMTEAARYSKLAREQIHSGFFVPPSPNAGIKPLIEDINRNMTVLRHDQTEVVSPKHVRREVITYNPNTIGRELKKSLDLSSVALARDVTVTRTLGRNQIAFNHVENEVKYAAKKKACYTERMTDNNEYHVAVRRLPPEIDKEQILEDILERRGVSQVDRAAILQRFASVSETAEMKSFLAKQPELKSQPDIAQLSREVSQAVELARQQIVVTPAGNDIVIASMPYLKLANNICTTFYRELGSSQTMYIQPNPDEWLVKSLILMCVSKGITCVNESGVQYQPTSEERDHVWTLFEDKHLERTIEISVSTELEKLKNLEARIQSQEVKRELTQVVTKIEESMQQGFDSQRVSDLIEGLTDKVNKNPPPTLSR